MEENEFETPEGRRENLPRLVEFTLKELRECSPPGDRISRNGMSFIDTNTEECRRHKACVKKLEHDIEFMRYGLKELEKSDDSVRVLNESLFDIYLTRLFEKACSWLDEFRRYQR